MVRTVGRGGSRKRAPKEARELTSPKLTGLLESATPTTTRVSGQDPRKATTAFGRSFTPEDAPAINQELNRLFQEGRGGGGGSAQIIDAAQREPTKIESQVLPTEKNKPSVIDSIKEGLRLVNTLGDTISPEQAALGGTAADFGPGLFPAGGGAAAAGAAATQAGPGATITRTATRVGSRKALTTQRAFIGKPPTSGIDKIFSASRPVASRFPTNAKSISLTNQLSSNLGLSIVAGGLLVGAVGTYPFAGFIKEEALQTLSFGFKNAEENNDLQGMADAINAQKEILNAEASIVDSVPYLNVQKQLRSFFDAAREKVAIDERVFERRSAGLS